jgi:hypothetical protein
MPDPHGFDGTRRRHEDLERNYLFFQLDYCATEWLY